MHSQPISRIVFAGILSCAALSPVQHAWAQFKPAAPAAAGAPAAITASAANRVQDVDSIIAVVNTDVITRGELEDRTRTVEQQLKAQGNTSLPPRGQLMRQVLERMIVEQAALQQAKEMGIQADDAMLDRALARIAEQNKMSLQEFRRQLEGQGMSYVKYREQIRREIIMQRLREREVDNKIQVSESEIENYLAAQGAAGAAHGQDEWNVAHILVRIPENASAEQIEQRRKRAEQLLAQLKSGADFAKLAAASSDADDALKGGELGWRSPDRLPQLFTDALDKANQGDIAPLVKSANGFHILKLVGKRAASVMKGGAAAPAAVQQTHARHILIRVNQIVSAADAQRKLLDLKQRIENKAATFEELAKSYSNDSTAAKGGDLGWIYPGDTVPEFERAMNALKIGEISEPIESPFGYHLIQVLERKTEDVSQERQRQAARMAIRERKLDEATQDWMRQLRDRAYVEYRFEER
ncbi:MAG: peptidylprolyl isomerase [Proteobacteria bacterium]|nr:peptidylprolyl isomerase [Pseudomonadota bacterium]